jgi:hypothetical protein
VTSFGSNDAVRVLEGSPCFTIGMLSQDEKWADEHTAHPAHDAILRPLLAASSECWVYGLKPDSEAQVAASEILVAERGKYRVNADGDPVVGYEYFWNARGGKRGTIVIIIPAERFPREIFLHCRGAWVFNNYRAGHTPAAINFAKKKAKEGSVVVCLPRNNGFEWAEVLAPEPLLLQLFIGALNACGGRY